MFAGKKSAQIREILISESAWEEMTCLFAPSKAASTGQALKSAEIKFYHINDAGQEVCYYTVLMENVKVTGVNCSVPNVKIAANDKMNHVESVSLQYEKITWRIVDGNIMHSDAWNERPTA